MRNTELNKAWKVVIKECVASIKADPLLDEETSQTMREATMIGVFWDTLMEMHLPRNVASDVLMVFTHSVYPTSTYHTIQEDHDGRV